VEKAAEALSITQPALPKTMRELEDAQGVRLP
jgi:DNA-binding transcriptional LysR family regulator